MGAPLSKIEADLCQSEALSGRIYTGQRNLYSRKITLILEEYRSQVAGLPLSLYPSATHAKILF